MSKKIDLDQFKTAVPFAGQGKHPFSKTILLNDSTIRISPAVFMELADQAALSEISKHQLVVGQIRYFAGEWLIQIELFPPDKTTNQMFRGKITGQNILIFTLPMPMRHAKFPKGTYHQVKRYPNIFKYKKEQ
jgi:hypothetical protein